MASQIDIGMLHGWIRESATSVSQCPIEIILEFDQTTHCALIYGRNAFSDLICIGAIWIIPYNGSQLSSQDALRRTQACIADRVLNTPSGYMSVPIFNIPEGSWITKVLYVHRNTVQLYGELQRSGNMEEYYIKSEITKVIEDNASAFLNPGVTPRIHRMAVIASATENVVRYGNWTWDPRMNCEYRVLTISNGTSRSEWRHQPTTQG